MDSFPLSVIHRLLASSNLLPLAVCATGIGYFALRAVAPAALERVVRLAQARWVWLSVCALFLATYVVTLALSTAYPGYLQHVEPQIAAVAFVVMKGAPMYHSLASAQRYALLYGPLAYLTFTVALATLGASVYSLKFVVLLANVVLVAALWRCAQRVVGPARAVVVTTGVLSLLLLNDYLFQVRGDVLLVLSVALGLLAVLRPPSWWSALRARRSMRVCVRHQVLRAALLFSALHPVRAAERVAKGDLGGGRSGGPCPTPICVAAGFRKGIPRLAPRGVEAPVGPRVARARAQGSGDDPVAGLSAVVGAGSKEPKRAVRLPARRRGVPGRPGRLPRRGRISRHEDRGGSASFHAVLSSRRLCVRHCVQEIDDGAAANARGPARECHSALVVLADCRDRGRPARQRHRAGVAAARGIESLRARRHERSSTR